MFSRAAVCFFSAVLINILCLTSSADAQFTKKNIIFVCDPAGGTQQTDTIQGIVEYGDFVFNPMTMKYSWVPAGSGPAEAATPIVQMGAFQNKHRLQTKVNSTGATHCYCRFQKKVGANWIDIGITLTVMTSPADTN